MQLIGIANTVVRTTCPKQSIIFNTVVTPGTLELLVIELMGPGSERNKTNTFFHLLISFLTRYLAQTVEHISTITWSIDAFYKPLTRSEGLASNVYIERPKIFIMSNLGSDDRFPARSTNSQIFSSTNIT